MRIGKLMIVLAFAATSLASAATVESNHCRSLTDAEIATIRGGWGRKCREISKYDCKAKRICPATGVCEGVADRALSSSTKKWYHCIFWFWESQCDPGDKLPCRISRPCIVREGRCQPNTKARPIVEQEAGAGCLNVAAPPAPL